MSIEITSRHADITSDEKEHAQEKAERIMDEFSRVENVHVILDAQKHHKMAEIIVQAKNHIRIEASDSSGEIWKAIDAASEKAIRQLRKARTKAQEHRVSGLSENEQAASELYEEPLA